MSWGEKTYPQTQCDREPIHQIAAIQGFGGMMVVTADWTIAHRSLNCADLLGLEALPQLGGQLSECFTERAMEHLRLALQKPEITDDVARLFGLRLTQGGDLMDCAIHLSGDNIVIEFEPHAAQDYADHIALVGPMLARLEPLRDVDSLCKAAATLVRQALGYDRVMVYRFHPDDSGEVIAEDRREDLEPYLGLRYPRADIPQQARELFTRNKFRIIADMSADSVPIEPALGFNSEPLDLSMSVLRAHSQMHVQYMKNMGVQASLTIAIVRQGRLWGMISCHHYEPRLLPYSLRTVAEMLSQMFSLMLDRILIDRAQRVRTKGRHLHDQLMLQLAGGNDLGASLPMLDAMVKDVIKHDGCSTFIGGKYDRYGAAPNEEEFLKLAPALGAAPMGTIIASNNIAQDMPEAAAFADCAAGALIVPISRSPRDYLVLWRRALTQTVTWAGNPEKAIVGSSNDRLQPRESFAAWKEEVRGRCEDWTADELEIAEGLRITLLEVILRMTDEIARERSRAQEKQELLIAELNHRVRNILNLIRGLVSQSQHDAIDVNSFATIIGGRIAALASAHDNITRENWSPAPLTALFETEIAAYLNEKKDRFELTGDDVLVTPEAYTVLALVVHELVTNSAKYGSLCDSTGSLSVDIQRTPFGDLKIAWRERGGPPVRPPTRRGFGSTIIERSIPYELKGEAELRFKLAGLEADFLLPGQYIKTGVQAARHSASETGQGLSETDDAAHSPMATGTRRVLVVEDSMIIALDTEENLKRLGVPAVDVASGVKAALGAIERQEPDLAIIDYNLGTESSISVAQELHRRRVPFALATGYAELSESLAELGAIKVLRKPYGRTEIEALLTEFQTAQAAINASAPAARHAPQ